jgi:ribonuclease/clavin/mitogillin
MANRVVKDSMIGMDMPDIARWSERVVVVLGQNPGAFTGPGTNTYIVGTGRERVLLDAGQGVADHLDLLEQALADHCDGAVIASIVLTHSHPDHIGGVEPFLERFGAVPVHKMPGDGDLGLAVEALADEQRLMVEGATLRALHTPGHAPDHLCFVLEEEGAVFTGDNVLGAGTTVIPENGDLGHYLDSLARLLELPAGVLYPAHGPALPDSHARVREIIEHRRLRDRQILEALDAGACTAEDMVARIYTDVPAFLHAAAAVSVRAHLRHFVARGILTADQRVWRRA